MHFHTLKLTFVYITTARQHIKYIYYDIFIEYKIQIEVISRYLIIISDAKNNIYFFNCFILQEIKSFDCSIC